MSGIVINSRIAHALPWFMWEGGAWCLTPIIVVLLLTLMAVVTFPEGSAPAPFIYTLF